MQKYDIVYILKNNYSSEELRYSLRSVCENFPYNKVWFYGGKLPDIEPDEYVELIQEGATKWEKVKFTLEQIFRNGNITEDFWLFNDDFFIMKPVDDLPYMINGTIERHAARIRARHNGVDSAYTRNLRKAALELTKAGYDQVNYALHVPMLINREKGLKTLKSFPNSPMFRSLYGNQWEVGGVTCKDVKIADPDAEPSGDGAMLSTTDKSFGGKVGGYIKEQFPKKCRYELQKK